jgi:hypothetical protein
MTQNAPSFLPAIAVLLITSFLPACTSYRVVELGAGVDENNIVNPFYAVARNRVVIPEYVVDRYGNYPTTREEARRRFEAQRMEAEPIIAEKYDLSKGSSGQASNYFLGFFLSLVSPIVVPIRWLGESFSGRKEKSPSFSEIGTQYFDASFNPPGYEKPRIKERIDYFY